MKKIVIFVVCATVMSVTASWMMEGCQEKLAPVSAIVATATPLPPDNIISLFNLNTLKMNTNLLNSLNGYFQNDTYADSSTAMTLTAPVPSDGNALALHIFGTYTDPGNGSYPAFELDGYPRSNNSYYDVSSFTGIKFSWNCPSDDNSVQRFFDLVTARIAPASAGGTGVCTSSTDVPCYDYFCKTLPNTGGTWVQETIAFSSLTLQYAPPGTNTAPTTVQPTDLQQILQLQWKNDSNNAAGSYVADYWIDNVEFY